MPRKTIPPNIRPNLSETPAAKAAREAQKAQVYQPASQPWRHIPTVRLSVNVQDSRANDASRFPAFRDANGIEERGNLRGSSGSGLLGGLDLLLSGLRGLALLLLGLAGRGTLTLGVVGRGPEGQVVAQQLHDEGAVTVRLLGQGVKLGNSVVERLLGEVASTVGRVQDLVVEDGEVESKAEADGVGRGELGLGDIGGALGKAVSMFYS